jgi:hypothetical protein
MSWDGFLMFQVDVIFSVLKYQTAEIGIARVAPDLPLLPFASSCNLHRSSLSLLIIIIVQ